MTDLAMSPDDRTEQFPGSASPVEPHHPQYLNEPQASQCRRGDRLTAVADTQQDYADDHHHHVCMHQRHAQNRCGG